MRSTRGEFTGTLDTLQFTNVEDGYATVGEQDPLALYVTNNGAKSWHRVTIQRGASILGISATSNAIYAITELCSVKRQTCHDYRIARSSLDAKHWLSWTFPGSTPYDGTDWGFFGQPAAYGSNLWIAEQPRGAALIYVSHDGGRTFAKIRLSNLGSVAGCSLTAESSTFLWAECPTGMQVSFAYSHDGGTTWTYVRQDQFFGTGGGHFDPVSAALAFLDYGATEPLVRYDGVTPIATTIGVFSCSKIDSSIEGLAFTDAAHGIALCQPGDETADGRLEITKNGGRTWERVTVETPRGQS